MRATGIADCIVAMTASQAATTVGKGHTPLTIVFGIPWSRSVILVTMPRVPFFTYSGRLASFVPQMLQVLARKMKDQ
jgi:hypothetical protein